MLNRIMALARPGCYTRVPHMVLLMSRPFKHPKNGIFWLRKRVPKDLPSIVEPARDRGICGRPRP